MTKPTLETLAQQVHSLTQSVSGLSQRVAENQRLFEENMRLKDVVIDLEYRLRENNQQAADLAALRHALEMKLKESTESNNGNGGNSNMPMIMPMCMPMGMGMPGMPVAQSGGNKSGNTTSETKAEESG